MLAIGCDHGGYSLKHEIIAYLTENEIDYNDFGTFSTDSCDYPGYAEKVARAVASGECDRGILVCGTGIGMSIAANKIRGVRCALCADCFSAEMTRKHNNANILALGERTTGAGLALKIVEIFLNTPFEGGRHERRVDMITKIEG